MLPPLKPIAMKERVSMVFIEKGQIDVKDGAFVVIDETGAFPTPVGMSRRAANMYKQVSFKDRSPG